jgi:hypothetical protein
MSQHGVFSMPQAPHELPGVEAELTYLSRHCERPIQYMYEPADGMPQSTGTFESHRVTISDARSLSVSPSVHLEGFDFFDAPTALRRFDDKDEIERIYYPEVVELACLATGATTGHVFDHVIRRREPDRRPLSFGRHGDGAQPAAVGRVHNDYTEMSGRRRLGLVLGEVGNLTKRRYSIVNVWRPLKAPVLDTPLAVCDARTLAAHHLVECEVRYQTRTGMIYLSTFSPEHRWFYYAAMSPEEALVFKQYDSQINSVARYTLHGAFDHPHVPAGAPLRESIEARVLVLYD